MLTKRSNEKEILDLGPNYYTLAEYQHCQKMLFRINKLLGFFKNTVKILKNYSEESRVLDVGCGGGLFLIHLSHYFPKMKLKGIDISLDAIEMAQQELGHLKKRVPETKVEFECRSQLDLNYDVDIILTTLVCHHLSNEEIISLMQQLHDAARKLVIIQDLHRHPIPYFFYKFLSPLLFKNRLITHDGLLSIKRSFTRKELQSLIKKTQIKHYKIKWCFPFHWRVILWKN